MATGKSKADRASRERARLYEARRRLHDAQKRRRRRDNVVVSALGALVLVGAVVAQTAYYSIGPGSSEPAPVGDTDVVDPGTDDPSPLPVDR